MQTVQLKGLHRLAVRDERGAETEAVLELRYRRRLVLAPVAKQKDYGPPVAYHIKKKPGSFLGNRAEYLATTYSRGT